MREVAPLLLAVGFLLFVPRIVEAQPVIDGEASDEDYIHLGMSPPDQPSDAPSPPYIGGVTSLHAHAGPDSLYVAVESKVRNGEDAFTRELMIFINSSAVDGVDSGTPLPAGSAPGSPFEDTQNMRMDMETDFGIRLTGDEGNPWAFASIADYAGYVAGDSTDDGKVIDSFETTLKSLDGTRETGQATGGTYAYHDTTDVIAVDGSGLGFEFSLPHDGLGTSQNDEFQFFAVYGDGSQDTLSATIIPDDGEMTLYEIAEDWTIVNGTQATGSQVLPVELVSFAARRDGKNAVLTWKTASETNNAGFAVQHAVGDDVFQQVGWVEGSATTTEVQSYRFVVEDLSAGTHRFRLRQKDLDGSPSLSKVVQVQVRPGGPIVVQEIAPNPVRETGTLRFTARESGDVSVALYDVLGRQVRMLHDGRVSGGQSQKVTIDASTLSSGVYFLRVKGDGFTRTERITIAQ